MIRNKHLPPTIQAGHVIQLNGKTRQGVNTTKNLALTKQMVTSFVGYVNEFNNSLNANGQAFEHDIVNKLEAMAEKDDKDDEFTFNDAAESLKQIHEPTEIFKSGTMLGQK